MELIDSPTERTTAATDVLLAVTALGCAAGLLPLRSANPFKVHVWQAAFALLAVAALIGAAIHGFKLEEGMRRRLWQPVNLSLGLTMALFVAAAVGDFWGRAAAQQALPALLLAGGIFFATTQLFARGFGLFLAYEALALLFALAVFVWMGTAGTLSGAWWMVLGVLLSVMAAGVQASQAVRVTLVWQFDHNGAFHLVQIVALLALFLGVHRAVTEERRGHSPPSEPPGEARRLGP